jgi:radical SAM superfamily enzyme YgiQ (UPF0313 family)
MMEHSNQKQKVLLTTVHRPLGINSENCTENIQAEMYHAQVTRAQGIFSVRTICTGWGLEFIAANLNVPVTVLHYPTRRILLRELKKGYDYLSISFVTCTFPKTIEACQWARQYAPETKIVLGGYGTVLKECDQYADYVCREEGVNFFQKLLGDKKVEKFVIPPIHRSLKIMSVTTRPEAIIPAGLGCSRGCDFCCTSHFFHKKYVPILKTGREIHKVMCSIDFPKSTFRNIGVIDEDFLADRRRMEDVIELNGREIKKLIFFSCLTSLKSLSQYTIDELLKMGLYGAWIGIESVRAKYSKLKDINAKELINSLKKVGIIPLTSMIVGYDWHDENSLEEDFQYLLSLKPAFSQFMMYSPCPQTPLYERMVQENRLLDVPYIYHDGFHALMKHPNLSSERLEAILNQFFQREYEELGPSVCRVMDILHEGYRTLYESTNPLFRARAREYKNLCLEIYPLLKIAIAKATTTKVRLYLKNLKGSVEESFQIPRSKKIMTHLVPVLSYYTQLKDWLIPHPQPKTEIHRYRFS